MIVPWIVHHVGGCGHVAGRAGGAGAVRRVMVMILCIVLARQVAAGADGIALGAQFSAVRIMAVAAGNALRVHLALQK